MKTHKRISFAVFILLLSKILLAETILIPQDQPTIQEGIDIANNGDTILVSPGIYYENIQISYRNIVLASLFLTTSDTSYISNTIIDGQNKESVVSILSGKNQLVGFTIQNGLGDGGYSGWKGGGINIEFSSPQIRHCIIRSNKCRYYGDGVICWDAGKPIFENCIFKNHSDRSIYLNSDSYPFGLITFKNCLIENNYIGIECNSAKINLINSTITQNKAVGLYLLDNSHVQVHNSIIWGNDKHNIYFFESYGPDTVNIFYSAIPTDTVSVVTNNNGVVNFIEGNIEQDPLFVEIDGRDYSLQKESPCVNAGNPDTSRYNLPQFDLSMNPRVIEGRVDMGAYEFQTETKVIDEVSNIFNYKLINYPNPFNPSTTILYSIPPSKTPLLGGVGLVTLKVYDILGKEVVTLVNEKQEPGNYEVSFNASHLSSGIYFYRLTHGEFSKTMRLILLK